MVTCRTVFYEVDGMIYWDYTNTVEPISRFLKHKMTTQVIAAYYMKSDGSAGVTQIATSKIRHFWAEKGQL